MHQVTSCEATLPAGSINATLLLLLLSTAVRRSATDPHIAGRRRRHALLHGQGPAAGGDHLRPRSTVRCTEFLFFFTGFLTVSFPLRSHGRIDDVGHSPSGSSSSTATSSRATFTANTTTSSTFRPFNSRTEPPSALRRPLCKTKQTRRTRMGSYLVLLSFFFPLTR